MEVQQQPLTDINRITVEFKNGNSRTINYSISILIESQWNLKMLLKIFLMMLFFILIESQWNLKQYMTLLHKKYVLHINRITVEFKKESYYHRSGAEEAY